MRLEEHAAVFVIFFLTLQAYLHTGYLKLLAQLLQSPDTSFPRRMVVRESQDRTLEALSVLSCGLSPSTGATEVTCIYTRFR